MKKLLLILLFLPMIGFGQISLLDEKNGCKGIELGTDISNYDFIKDNNGNKGFTFSLYMLGDYIWNERFSWGSPSHYVDLDKLENKEFLREEIQNILIETYKNKISKIIIVINRKDGIRGMYHSLKEIFGHSEHGNLGIHGVNNSLMGFKVDGKYNRVTELWLGEKVTMVLQSFHLKNEVKRPIGYIVTLESKPISKIKETERNIENEKQDIENEKNRIRRKKNSLNEW